MQRPSQQPGSAQQPGSPKLHGGKRGVRRCGQPHRRPGHPRVPPRRIWEWPSSSPSPTRSAARPRRRHGRARGLHAPDPARGGARADPAGAARPDARPDDARRDLRPADRGGLRARARLLVGRESGRRLAAPAARRGRARLAAAARARGALARRDGGRVCGRRRGPAVRRPARVRGHGPARSGRAWRRSPARSRARSSRRCRRTGPDVGIVHAQQADRRGNVQLWGIAGVQKEVVLASARSLATVEEVVDELEPRPGRGRPPGWALDAVCVRRAARIPSYAHGYYDRDNDFYVALGRDQPRPRHLHGLDGAARARDARTSASTTRACAPREPTRADEMMAVEAARRLARRRRSASSGSACRASPANLARATHAPGLRAHLRERHDRREARRSCRSRSATASSPRRPTRSSPCRRCSPTGSRAAASTSASSARRRSTASATSTAR